MTKHTIGCNDPCPCGSGLKYKKCCLGRRSDPPNSGAPDSLHDEVRQALEGRDFDSLEEANAFLADYTRQRSQQPLADFAGLSSEQMYRLLYYPFESPDLVLFPQTLPEEPKAPILTLFSLLVEAIGEQGLKPTAKGNLPRKFCREAALAFWGEEAYGEHTKYGAINKEEDFFDLHVTRVVAELVGLVRKYKGKFILSRNCRSLLAQGGMAAVYPQLLQVCAKEFNWAYRDGYAELPFIQQSFLFTLYLLSRFGNDWRSSVFYEDHFLQAFPMVLDELMSLTYQTPEQQARSCYTLRTLVHFAGFLGLATVEPVESDQPLVRQYRVKKSPQLDNAVQFSLKS
ncbi:MAG: hypothetical protein BA870_02300 [Desulfuromonadales bacterium C00003094]|nr:MAG: hypothetical protein BA870_02300 [Desulfuromonadales bacterium C00003094]